MLDLLIIGAGPAGISAAFEAERQGLRYLVLEKGLIANTVYQYPVGLTVFSTPNELEMQPGTLTTTREKPTREELLSYYVRFALDHELRIRTEEKVLSVEKMEDHFFQIETESAEYQASNILFAVGAMDHPRRLNVQGENGEHVHHRFTEAYPYVLKHALVVGGGNSAAEAALFLSEEGAKTTLAIWRADWENTDPAQGAIKKWVRKPLEKQIKLGRLKVFFFSEITRISDDHVYLKDDHGQAAFLPVDVVFILIGSDADLTILKELGVETEDSKHGEVPVYNDENFETNIPGIYVAGHFTRSRHIKEAIEVPRRIVPLIAAHVKALDRVDTSQEA
jgi:thioredoxin reductase (NADPH)